MSLSNSKTALLHVGKKRLGFDDDTWRGFLERAAGVRSSRELLEAGLDRMMEAFKKAGFTRDFSKADFGNRRPWCMTNARQVTRDCALESPFTGRGSGDRTLRKSLPRQGWPPGSRFLAATHGRAAIGALRRMLVRKTATTGGEPCYAP